MKIKAILTFLIILTISSFAYSMEGEVFVGYSSWYGDKFHGRKTASGEVYDMNKLTAAHRTLPFGTYVEVTNLDNNKKIIVKINDRGPFAGNRIIDVSKQTAIQLGFLEKGITRVRLRVLGNKYYSTSNPINNSNQNKSFKTKSNFEVDGDEAAIDRALRNQQSTNNNTYNQNSESYKSTTSTNPQPTNTNPQPTVSKKEPLRVFIIQTQEAVKKNPAKIYKIQFGAYSNIEFAIDVQRKMTSKGVPTLLCVYRGEGSVFRLLSKQSFKDQQSAIQAVAKLKEMGISCFTVEL